MIYCTKSTNLRLHIETTLRVWYNQGMKISKKKNNILANTAVEPRETPFGDPAAPETITEAAAETVIGTAPQSAEPAEAEPKHASRPRRTIKLLTYLAIPLFAILFALSVYFGSDGTLVKLIAPAIALIYFAFVTLLLVPRLVLGRDPSEVASFGERSSSRLHPIFKIVVFSLFAQLAAVVLVYALHSIVNGVDSALAEGYAKLFVQPRGLIFGENTRSAVASMGLASFFLPAHIERLSGEMYVYIPVLVFNALAVAASAVFLYELALCDCSKRRAKFSVLLLFILPSVLLIMQPFSGTAPFMALSLLSLLLARRKKPIAAGICALLASLFNILAVLLAVPIALECIIHFRSVSSSNADELPSRRVKPLSAVLSVVLALLPIAAGFILRACGLNGLTVADSIGERLLPIDPLGRLLSEWNGASMPNLIVGVCAAVLLIVWLIVLFGAAKTRSSHTALALLFSMVPALIRVDMTLYVVFAMPLLTLLIGSKCTIKPARFIVGLSAFVILILAILFLYVKRSI